MLKGIFSSVMSFRRGRTRRGRRGAFRLRRTGAKALQNVRTRDGNGSFSWSSVLWISPRIGFAKVFDSFSMSRTVSSK